MTPRPPQDVSDSGEWWVVDCVCLHTLGTDISRKTSGRRAEEAFSTSPCPCVHV